MHTELFIFFQETMTKYFIIKTLIIIFVWTKLEGYTLLILYGNVILLDNSGKGYWGTELDSVIR